MPVSESEAQAALQIFSALKARNLVALVEDVCRRRGVLIHEICSRSRSLNVSRARQELWWHIRNLPDRSYSYPEIARLFQRDQTTIRQGIAAHRRRQLT